MTLAWRTWLTWLPLALMALGCAGSGSTPAPTTPLSIDEWKSMVGPQKYEVDTFERLREGNPTLRDPVAWDRFFRTVVVPQKRRDGIRDTIKADPHRVSPGS